MSAIKANIEQLEKRIRSACDRAGRTREEVRLIAVTKTHPPIAIAEALHHGITDIGENRVQEAAGKFDAVQGAVWHLVGPLQSNKARKAVQLFDWIQTVDSEKLAERLDRIAGEMTRKPNVLIQVNVGAEEQKSGVAPDDAPPLARIVEAADNLELHGLMTVPPMEPEPELRRHFTQLRAVRDRCSEAIGRDLAELSMGMTDDFETAIEEGATMIRIGRAIFGERV